MTGVFDEHPDSRAITQTTSGQGVRLRWNARGYGSGSTAEALVRADLVATAPTAWDGLTLVGFAASPHANSGAWDATADYAYSTELANGVKGLTAPGVDDPLGPEFEFDLTAQQAHITQSLETVTSRFDPLFGGSGPPAWAASTAYEVGATVTKGGNLYRCTVAGTSAGSGGPSGTTSPITDGTVVWIWGSAAPAATTAWAALTAYTAGARVDNNGFLYECLSNGTSAGSGGPIGTGSSISDGSTAWKYIGPDVDPGAPSYGGAIGVTRDRVVGTDVYTGHLEFSITTQYYPMTLRLLETMLTLVGRFNSATWYNFPPKTLLYLGATGAPRPGNIWTLKHRFAASPNVSNIQVGRITIPWKGGWDYLWAAYRDSVVTLANGSRLAVQVPYAAYVEQIYRPGDFTTLPIAA